MDSDADAISQAYEQGQESGTDGDNVARRVWHGINYRLHIEPNGCTGTDAVARMTSVGVQ